MPKSCKECDFYLLGENSCSCTGFIINYNNIIIDKNCPLIELPEENKDMSWEELVFKLGDKALNKSSELGCIAKFEIEPCGLSFYEDGCVLDEHNDYILTKQTPYQMWVIIKALIGDER